MKLKSQSGLSLIELLVGMTISLIIILGMLSLYKFAINNVYGSSDGRGMIASSTQDGQLATGLLIAQQKLQAAGFGISSPSTANNFISASGVSLAPATGILTATSGNKQNISTANSIGNAIFWESNPSLGANNVCNGLVSATNTKALYFLARTASCNPLGTNWNDASSAWTVTTLVAPNTINNQITFTTKTSATACRPYGLSDMNLASGAAASSTYTNAGLSVSINYSNSSSNSSNNYTVCLSNY